MLSNEIAQNATLIRPNSKSGRTPFIVPTKDTFSASSHLRNDTRSSFHSRNIASGMKSAGTAVSKRSLIMRPESIKRANNDAFMAAAIGDLDWLKQSLKISSEMAFDKNGFAIIHLAAIHGRQNVLIYLVEELLVDTNFPSAHGWRPIHLCISKKIGDLAVDCLRYLISNGAEINISNEDGVQPLHMAASEGHLECLQILLENKADPFAVDHKNQMPVDLARLWGHKKCAKCLASSMWHNEKILKLEKINLTKKMRTQEILLDVQKAYADIRKKKQEKDANKENAKSKQVKSKVVDEDFQNWLNQQGLTQTDKDNAERRDDTTIKVTATDKKTSLPSIIKSVDKLGPIIDNTSKNIKFAAGEKHVEPPRQPSVLSIDSRDDVGRFLFSSQDMIDDDRNKRRKTLEQEIPEEERPVALTQWNYSTKVEEKEYVKELDDFYPRDPYTLIPKDYDLLLLHRQLHGMTLDEIKEFMSKDWKKREEILKKREEKMSIKDKNKFKEAKKFDTERPVYHRPKNIIDYEKRKIDESHNQGTDTNASFVVFNGDKNLFHYKRAKKFIQKRQYIEKHKSEPVLSNDDKTYEQKDVERIRNILSNEYDSELYQFMTKKNGKLKDKYERVFII